MLAPWKKSYDKPSVYSCSVVYHVWLFVTPMDCGHDKPRHYIKKQRHHFANKSARNQSYGFSCYHIWMWELDHKEGWAPKNWWFWTVVLKKTPESPLDSKETKPDNPKGNKLWIIIGKTDTEVETRILWLSDGKNWLLKRCWFWEELKAGPEGGDRGWDSWMASPTQWTWVWVNAWSWWWTWRPGMLQSIVSKRLGHSWATELTVWYKGFSLNLLK